MRLERRVARGGGDTMVSRSSVRSLEVDSRVESKGSGDKDRSSAWGLVVSMVIGSSEVCGK